MLNRSLTALFFATALVGVASAQVSKPGDPNLGGTISANTWNDLSAANYPTGFPANSIQGGSTATAGASLNRTSGSAVFSSGSIYGGFAGPTSVFSLDAKALSGVQTVVFQIRIGTGIGDINAAPKLNYTTVAGGTGSLTTTQQLLERGTDTLGGQGVTVSLYKYQWNLSGLGAVDKFSIGYGVGLHSTTTNIRLDQSTQAVPEPASMAALAMGGLALLRRRRKA